MILEDTDSRIELSLLGYEFPDLRDDEHDANWLKVQLDVRCPTATYSATANCLITTEVRWLELWLENLASDRPQMPRWHPLEPELRIEHLDSRDDLVQLRVHASDSFGPPGQPRVRRAPSGRVRGVVPHLAIDLMLTRDQLRAAAEALRAQLAVFPLRGDALTKPPFRPPRLLSRFRVYWLLDVPADSEVAARELFADYMEWIDLSAQIESIQPDEEDATHWTIDAVSELSVRADEPFRALFVLLSHLPLPFGLPRISKPYLRPDGVFSAHGRIDPTVDPDHPHSWVSGSFWLTNLDEDEPARRVLMARHSRRPTENN